MPTSKPGAFQKVGECLYRYSSNGVYYARFELRGKEIRRSLETTDKTHAKRNLTDLQRTLRHTTGKGDKQTLAQLCDSLLAACRNQAPATIYRKEAIARRVKADWPGGVDRPISKVTTSEAKIWLAKYGFKKESASYDLHLCFLKEAFDMAVEDGSIEESPVAGMKTQRPKAKKRETPSVETFLAIVANIRAQKFNADAEESADFVEFIGLAGLGQAEASSLTWADVEWTRGEMGEIRTYRHKTKAPFHFPIYPQLRPLLERLQLKRESHSPQERVLRINDAKKALAAACRRLNLPSYSHRAYRRMFIESALRRGVDVKTIAEWQGHSDGGKLVLQVYSQMETGHGALMAKLMSTGKVKHKHQLRNARPKT